MDRVVAAPHREVSTTTEGRVDIDEPRVSVVIPTFNEERFIRRCLESVRLQDYPADRIEILVVDNGSTDDTLAICREFSPRILQRPGTNVSGMRNAGAAEASGNVLAFLDADCAAHPDWLREAVRSLQEEPCVTGSTYLVPDTPHWIEDVWFSQEPRGRMEVTHINAGNLVVERDVFLGLSGFDERMQTGEDYEFAQRARRQVKIIADDRIRVVHFGNPKTLRRFFQREVWHGLGALGSFRHDWRDKPLWGSIIFGVLCVAQLVGIVLLGAAGQSDLLLAATAGIALLIGATVFYRLRLSGSVTKWSQLAVLYYVFYLGRAVALVRIAAGAGRYLREK